MITQSWHLTFSMSLSLEEWPLLWFTTHFIHPFTCLTFQSCHFYPHKGYRLADTHALTIFLAPLAPYYLNLSRPIQEEADVLFKGRVFHQNVSLFFLSNLECDAVYCSHLVSCNKACSSMLALNAYVGIGGGECLEDLFIWKCPCYLQNTHPQRYSMYRRQGKAP